jgi:hypothetical protein
MNRDAMLLVVALAGPAIWFFSLEANFALAPLACTMHGKAALYAVSIISLLLVAGLAMLAWGHWRQLSREYAGGSDDVSSQSSRALALGGAALNALSFIVILAQTVPNLILTGCE